MRIEQTTVCVTFGCLRCICWIANEISDRALAVCYRSQAFPRDGTLPTRDDTRLGCSPDPHEDVGIVFVKDVDDRCRAVAVEGGLIPSTLVH